MAKALIDRHPEIVGLADVAPSFEPDTSKPDPSGIIGAVLEEKQKKTGLYLSDSTYLNLYDFALALNGRYCGGQTADEMKRAFEEGLSLAYKLSNIAQAKGFARRLERTRLHHDLVPFGELPHAEVLKDSEPILKMLELIREFGGLSIYRM